MLLPNKLPPRDADSLLELLHTYFPQLQWSGYEIVRSGWDHEVLILDDSFVFRFPNDRHYGDLLQSEIQFLKELKSLTAVNIPDYTLVAPDFKVAGYPIVPGRALTKKLFARMGPEERNEIARQLAGILTTMHTLIEEGHELAYVPGWDFAEEQAETKQAASKHLPSILSTEDYGIVRRILSRVDKLSSEKLPQVFVHGDIYSDHLLWDRANLRLGIIDFSDMSRGDPALDFAELYDYGKEFVQSVYAYYAGRKDPTFLERAWTYDLWTAVYMMTDHFSYHKTSFAEARQLFDEVKGHLDVI